jgi:hypothetical protein
MTTNSRTLAQGYPLVAVDKEDMSVWAVIGWVEPTVGARYPLLAPLGVPELEELLRPY